MFLKNNLIDTQFDLLFLPSQSFYKPFKQSLFIKHLTGKEEIVLTSPMLHEAGKAIDLVLKSCILDEDVNFEDLILPDKQALMMFLRINSFGSKIELNITCPHCQKEGKSSFDLISLQAKDIIELPDENGEHTYNMKNFKLSSQKDKNEKISVVVKFKPLTISDEKKIKLEIENIKSGNKNEMLIRYKYQIVSINGNADKNFIIKVIKNLPIVESKKMREYFEKILPGIQNEITLKCQHCQKDIEDTFNLDINLLGITPEYRENLLEELFLVTYYGKDISYDSALNMPTSQRKWWINRISAEIEKKNKAEEDAVKKSQSKR